MFSYVQTRWNSSLYMVQSLLQQKSALSVFAAECNQPATLTAQQWELLNKTTDVLSPFEQLTRDMSRETATVALVIPNFYFYLLFFTVTFIDDDDEGIKTMTRTVMEAVEKRFADVETEPLLYIATLLHPRYKDGQSANLLLAKERRIQEVAKTEVRRAASAVPEENEAAAEPVSKAPRHEACSRLDIALEEIVQERQSQGRSVSTTSAETQVQTYLSEKNIPKKSDPFRYWKEHANQFPSMAATQYVSAPCSSVDNERLLVLLQTSLMKTKTGLNLTR
ncbi:hypothetical protein ACEWY4_018244 [Coilia grayii]|uniref:HAT C-terminal dimerisation domain-containing protein n=1 Tax=Coilia grayii TaxID=363190 RepID=A0ABD1JJB2_9TELE